MEVATWKRLPHLKAIRKDARIFRFILFLSITSKSCHSKKIVPPCLILPNENDLYSINRTPPQSGREIVKNHTHKRLHTLNGYHSRSQLLNGCIKVSNVKQNSMVSKKKKLVCANTHTR